MGKRCYEQSLGERRVIETNAAAKVLGVAQVEFLGYVDSGMMGEPENDAPGSFWSADIEEAERLTTAFAGGWRIDSIERTILDSPTGGIAGWLVALTREDNEC